MASDAPVQLLVFDWDGTLMDSTAHIAASIQAACSDVGLPIPPMNQASHVIGLGLHEALAKVVPDIRQDQVPLLVDRYRFHYLSADERLVLFSGVREMLVDFKERGHCLAVATGKSRVGLNRALHASGLQPLFDATRCADETHSKPHPAMLLELMDQLGVGAASTFMIGDTTHDLLMAANAGTRGVAVSYGAHEVEHLRTVPSAAMVHSVAELHSTLLKMTS